MANLVHHPQSLSALAGMPEASSDDHLIEMWLEKSESPRTQRVYRRVIKRFRGWLKDKPLQRVTALELLAYQEAFDPKWSDATRNQQKAAIKSLWTYGCEIQYFPFNIPHAVYKLKKPRPVTAERILTDDQMQEAIDAEPNPKARLFLRFLYSTALRATEAIDVTWDDFKIRGDRVFLHVQHGKGDEFREVGCSALVYMDLWDAKPENAKPTDKVFRITYITAWRWVKDAFTRIGKPAASPHWARHAHAVVSHEHGADWHSISRQLGHANASFTMDRYGHFTGDHSSDFIDC
ncbi:MAG: tyrosine-type recombinase/integrase [Cyanobacteria bacterium J06638_20]